MITVVLGVTLLQVVLRASHMTAIHYPTQDPALHILLLMGVGDFGGA